MSIHVENNLRNSNNKEIFKQTAHYMPCKIEDDGPANVNKYFDPCIVEQEGKLTSTFRGHPLDGVREPLPEGYTAVLLTESKRPLAEGADRKFQVAGGFKDVTLWSWDRVPGANEPLTRAFSWAPIAAAGKGLSDLINERGTWAIYPLFWPSADS